MLIFIFMFAWIDKLGKERTESLFESTGEPRRIYESKISIWDKDKKIARLIANNLEEMQENSWLISDIQEALFYRNYEPYVEVEAKSAKYNDLMETLEFSGPFTATTKDDIVAKTMRAFWTKKSQLLFFPDSVNLKNLDVDITGEDVLFETNEDNVIMIGQWHAKLLESEENPSIEGGLAVYNTQNGIITAQSRNWEKDKKPQSLIAANREPIFKSLGVPQLSPPGKPTFRTKNWRISSEILEAKSKDKVAYLSDSVLIEEIVQKNPRKIKANNVEYYWNPGYFNFTKNVTFEENNKTINAESGFFDKNNDYFKLEGPVLIEMKDNFLDEGSLPIISITRLVEVTKDPDRYLFDGGFSWVEGDIFFGGKNGEWDPKLEQLTIKESAEYSNKDFQVLSTSVRANSNLVKFLGKSTLSYGELFQGEVQNLKYEKELDAISSGPLKGNIDENEIIALSLRKKINEDLWSLTESKITLNKNLHLESKILDLDTKEKLGTTSMESKVKINNLEIIAKNINFGWSPLMLECNDNCQIEDSTWVGNSEKITVKEENTYEIFNLNAESKKGWLGVEEKVSIETKRLVSKESLWEMETPKLNHPHWTIEGLLGKMREDSSQITITGKVSIKNTKEKRNAFGERWSWSKDKNTTTLEGYPRILGEKDELLAEKLIKIENFWEGLGPIQWTYYGDNETTLLSEGVFEEDGGYRFEKNIEMEHKDVNVYADYAKVRTNAENIIFYGNVVVKYKDGNIIEGDRFVWDLLIGKGTIENAFGNIAID